MDRGQIAVELIFGAYGLKKQLDMMDKGKECGQYIHITHFRSLDN